MSKVRCPSRRNICLQKLALLSSSATFGILSRCEACGCRVGKRQDKTFQVRAFTLALGRLRRPSAASSFSFLSVALPSATQSLNRLVSP